MATFNFNNQPTATVSKEFIFDLFAQLDLTWHGMNEFGRYEQELIEDELNVGIEIKFKSDVKRTRKNIDNIDNYQEQIDVVIDQVKRFDPTLLEGKKILHLLNKADKIDVNIGEDLFPISVKSNLNIEKLKKIIIKIIYE